MIRYLLAFLLLATAAHAQNAIVLPSGLSCGDATPTPGVGQLYMDSTGKLCVAATATATTTATASATPTTVTAGTDKPLNISLNSEMFVAPSIGGTPVSLTAPMPGYAMLYDGANAQRWLTGVALADGVNGNNSGTTIPYVWNGTTFDRMPGTTNGVKTLPGTLTLTSLDVASVTTGGTAVAALSAGHRTRGGWIQNPKGAAQDLCINEKGTAAGTTSAGDTICIAAGQTYTLAPSGNAVSVISSDSSHPFAGYGFN